jgi:hypothetical protein
MGTNKALKPRPYWHVDAKWLTGILLLFLLNITFVVLLMVQITAPEQGITLLTTALASSFSVEEGGLDASGSMDTMHQKIAESPNGEWQPIPGMRIVVREADIFGKTPREVRLWFFRQWAEPLYYDGAQGLAGLMTDPKMQNEAQGGIGALEFITAETHKKLQGALAVSGLVSLFFFGLLIFFSYRFGRLGSPGCVIFLAAAPGLIFMGGARGWLEQAAQRLAAVGQETYLTRYTQLAVDVLPGVVQTALQIYVILFFLGLVMMLIALIGIIFVRERKNKEQQTEREIN